MSLPYSERGFAYPQPFNVFGAGDGAQESQVSQYSQQIQIEHRCPGRLAVPQAGSSADAYLPSVQLTNSERPHDVTIHGGNGHEDVVSGIKPKPGETLPELIKRLHPQLSGQQLNEEIQHMLKYNKDYGNNLGDGSHLDPNTTVFLTSVEYADAEGRPTRIESPTGRVTEFTYDGSGLAGYKITEPNGVASEGMTRSGNGQWIMTRPDGRQVPISNLSVDAQGDITATDTQGDKIGHLTRGDDIYTKYSGAEPVQALTEREGKAVSRYQYKYNDNTKSTYVTYADNPSQSVLLDQTSEALQRAQTAQGEDPTSGSSTYDGADTEVSRQTVEQNAQIVAQVARQMGVDPVTAVATMLVESGGNNDAVGDGGTSFGLFQLHEGGELGSLSQAQADDPVRNARVALSVFRSNAGASSDPGVLAALSQRPADQAAYAQSVDAKLAGARQLLGMA